MSEELDAIDSELLEAIAKVKGHAVRKAEPRPVSEIYPVSAVAAKAWLAAEKESLENPSPGQQMPDGTVFVGKYSPSDREGRSLGQEFNVFAAPEDLPQGPHSYDDTVKNLAALKNWNGHDGAKYADDTKLYDALINGAYNGQWIIPTKEILCGKNYLGKEIMTDNLSKLGNAGILKGTFHVAAGCWSDNPIFYWSCTANNSAGFVPACAIFAGDYWSAGDS